MNNAKHKLILISIIFLIISVVSCLDVHAQEPQFTLSKPVNKKITREHVYRFYLMQYDPPVEIQPTETNQKTLKEVSGSEKTVREYVAAQAQGNYERYYGLLNKNAQEKLNSKLMSDKRTPADLITEWRHKYSGKKVILTHRIERSSDTIIHYRLVSKDGTIAEGQDIAVDVLGKIIDLSGDVVYENWNFQGPVKKIEPKNDKK
jgi:hypothetical protein